jgi:hypothetical protein
MRRIGSQLALVVLLLGCREDEQAPRAEAPPPPPERVHAPNNGSSWDGAGADVIDVEPSPVPYQVGPNPSREEKPR